MLEWGGVELRPMPLGQIAEETNHPRGHLLALPASFAWKGPRCHSLHFAHFLPLTLFKARVIEDALNLHAHVFYMDAGQELRWPMDEIERRLRLAGNFHVAQEGWTSNCTCCGNSYVFTHAGTLQALGIPPALILGRPMSAGGIQARCADLFKHISSTNTCSQGYVNGSTATRAVLRVAAKCSGDVDCIYPDGASGRNHRWDQAVFTALLHLAGVIKNAEFQSRNSAAPCRPAHAHGRALLGQAVQRQDAGAREEAADCGGASRRSDYDSQSIRRHIPVRAVGG